MSVKEELTCWRKNSSWMKCLGQHIARKKDLTKDDESIATWVRKAAPFALMGACEGGGPGVVLAKWSACVLNGKSLPKLTKIVRAHGFSNAFAIGIFAGTSSVFKCFAEKNGLGSLGSPFFAGVFGTLFLNPIEMNIVYGSMNDGKSGWKVISRLGVRGFMVGSTMAALRNAMVAFGAYHKPFQKSNPSLSERVAYAVISGTILGMVSQFPHDLSLWMKMKALEAKKPVRIVQSAKMMRKTVGVRAFFQSSMIRSCIRMPIFMVMMVWAQCLGGDKK